MKIINIILFILIIYFSSCHKQDKFDHYEKNFRHFLSENFNLKIEKSFNKKIIIIPLDDCGNCINSLFQILIQNKYYETDIIVTSFSSYTKNYDKYI